MDKEEAFLTLLQMADSFFPSGSFAYSWGLESYVQEGTIVDQGGLQEFLEAYLAGFVARSDGLFMKLAFEAARREDMEEIFLLDRRMHSMKLARELREGSIQTGRQLFLILSGLHPRALFDCYAAGLAAGRARGHQAVVYGLVCGCLGIDLPQAVLAHLYQTAAAIVSAGVRLIPLGHRDGQKTLEGIKAKIKGIAGDLLCCTEEDLSSFAPGLEIRAMQHERLYVRLFKA